jgi:hypothetical protein
MPTSEQKNPNAPEKPLQPVEGRSEDEGATLLKEAQLALSDGDHLKAGRLATSALESKVPSIQQDASLLLEQISPAPLAKYLLLLTFVLLFFVTLLAYQR